MEKSENFAALFARLFSATKCQPYEMRTNSLRDDFLKGRLAKTVFVLVLAAFEQISGIFLPLFRVNARQELAVTNLFRSSPLHGWSTMHPKWKNCNR